MTARVELRRGSYRDSVTLMQMSEAVAQGGGVDAAIVAMATPLNIELYERLGFDPADVADATANDLLVAIRAADDAALNAAIAQLDALLVARTAPDAKGFGAPPPPRTLASALRTGGSLALISVPGEHAFVEAMDAVNAGVSVMLFSDNVSVSQEIALKETAASTGSLVMGPDCGTAVVGGLGLGFANSLRPGPVGIVAASGTGAQQVSCLLDAADVGVTAVLGVGGRDLSAAVGGRSTLAAMQLLDRDPATELVVVLSKPPDPMVAEQVRVGGGRAGHPFARRVRGTKSGRSHRDDGESPCRTGHRAGRTGGMARALRAPTPAGLPARAVLRRDALRRVDGDRGRQARTHRVQHTARSTVDTRCRPACTGSSHDRLR